MKKTTKTPANTGKKATFLVVYLAGCGVKNGGY